MKSVAAVSQTVYTTTHVVTIVTVEQTSNHEEGMIHFESLAGFQSKPMVLITHM